MSSKTSIDMSVLNLTLSSKMSKLNHMKKVFALVNLSIFLFQVRPVSAAPQQVKDKSFTQWCQQKNSLPAATRHTINILLKKADTNNCQLANAKILSLNKLDLEGNGIIDIQPLARFSKLTDLRLSNNQISDVKPLAGLTNLNILYLNINKISVKSCPVKPPPPLTSICQF